MYICCHFLSNVNVSNLGRYAEANLICCRVQSNCDIFNHHLLYLLLVSTAAAAALWPIWSKIIQNI